METGHLYCCLLGRVEISQQRYFKVMSWLQSWLCVSIIKTNHIDSVGKFGQIKVYFPNLNSRVVEPNKSVITVCLLYWTSELKKFIGQNILLKSCPHAFRFPTNLYFERIAPYQG